MWLYKLTNKVNSKAYIGTSVNPISHRVSRHLYAAKNNHTVMLIHKAIRKYGLESFLVECIGRASDYAELMQIEKEAIASHNTLQPNGYNISIGGGGSFGRKNSAETKRKMGLGKIGKPSWNAGKKVGPLSEEHRRKLSEIHKGQKAWNKGIPHKPETLAKYKNRVPWNKGKQTGPMSDEQRMAIAETMRKVRAANPGWSTKKKKQETPPTA